MDLLKKSSSIPIYTTVEIENDKSSATSTSTAASTSLVAPFSENYIFSDFVMISSDTKFKDLLSSIYSQIDMKDKDDLKISDGFIVIKNWRPLSLKNECFDGMRDEKTVHEALHHLLSFIRLHIHLTRISNEDYNNINTAYFNEQAANLFSNQHLKQKLLLNNLLMQLQHNSNTNLSPSNLRNNNNNGSLAATKSTEISNENAAMNLANFYSSYAAMNNILMATSSLPSLADTTYPLTSTTTNSASSLTSNSSLSSMPSSLRPNASPLAYQCDTPLNLCKNTIEYPYHAKYNPATTTSNASSNSSLHNNNNNSSAIKLKSGSANLLNSNSRRQRERTTFDPQEELPRLIQIFERTHHPTRYQISSICEELNALNSRKGKKPLEPYNIQYWFKNARAALRRRSKLEQSVLGEFSEPNVNRMSGSRLSAAHSRSSSSSKGLKREFFDDEEDYDEEEEDEKYDDEFDVDDDATAFEFDFDDNDGNKKLVGGEKERGEKKNEMNVSVGEEKMSYRKLDSSLNSSINENDEIGDDESFDDEIDDCNTEIDVDDSAGGGGGAFCNKQFKNKSLLDSCSGSGGGVGKSASRRNRIFIDPVSEVPILEEYFKQETYPDQYLIGKICDALNQGEYRHKYPKLEARNIQLWFKNHRAKLKRLKYPIKSEDEAVIKDEPGEKQVQKASSTCSTSASSLSTVSSNANMKTIASEQQPLKI